MTHDEAMATAAYYAGWERALIRFMRLRTGSWVLRVVPLYVRGFAFGVEFVPDWAGAYLVKTPKTSRWKDGRGNDGRERNNRQAILDSQGGGAASSGRQCGREALVSAQAHSGEEDPRAVVYRSARGRRVDEGDDIMAETEERTEEKGLRDELDRTELTRTEDSGMSAESSVLIAQSSSLSTQPKGRYGFASMDPGKQREIARLGGLASHEKGTAHEWTSEEAREAGRKGGEKVSRDRRHMAEIGRIGGSR